MIPKLLNDLQPHSLTAFDYCFISEHWCFPIDWRRRSFGGGAACTGQPFEDPTSVSKEWCWRKIRCVLDFVVWGIGVVHLLTCRAVRTIQLLSPGY